MFSSGSKIFPPWNWFTIYLTALMSLLFYSKISYAQKHTHNKYPAPNIILLIIISKNKILSIARPKHKKCYYASGSGFKICAILEYVPKTKPKMPKHMMPMSFHRIQLLRPNWFGQNVMISMSGGKMSANVELLTAPTNEMIGPKFGMIAANMTADEQKNANLFINYFKLTSHLHVNTTSVMRKLTSLMRCDCSDRKKPRSHGLTMLTGT